MKAKVQLRRAGSDSRDKLSYIVGIQLFLEEEEKELIAEYQPLVPLTLHYLKFGEHHQERVEKALRDQNALDVRGFEKGVAIGFTTIEGACGYEDAVLKAFTLFRAAIDQARTQAAKLGIVREIDI